MVASYIFDIKIYDATFKNNYMKIKTSINVLLLVISVFISCNNQHNEEIYENYPSISTYKIGDLLFEDSNNPIGDIVNINVVDSILLIGCTRSEYAYYFINKNNGKLIAKWGQVGNGANEFLSFSLDISLVNDSVFAFYDNNKKEIYYTNIKKIIRGEDAVEKIETYPYTKDFRNSNIKIIGNKKIALGCYETGNICLITPDGEMRTDNCDCIFKSDDVPNLYKGTIFQGFLSINNKTGNALVCYMNSDAFAIYETTDSTLSRKYVNAFNHAPSYNNVQNRFHINSSECVYGFSKPYVTEDNIYLIYNGEYDLKPDRVKSREILCLDWDGNKKEKINLPISISLLCCDGDKIYGVKPDDSDSNNCIYLFVK